MILKESRFRLVIWRDVPCHPDDGGLADIYSALKERQVLIWKIDQVTGFQENEEVPLPQSREMELFPVTALRVRSMPSLTPNLGKREAGHEPLLHVRIGLLSPF